MNNDNREWLSALTDGELHGQELGRGLDTLRNEPELQQSWLSYHLVRDAISSNLNHAVDPQMHLRISAAIAAEPTILAPQRRSRPWLKQAAGVAIAASVTGVAILGIQSTNGVDSGHGTAQVAQPQEYIRMEPTLVASGQAKALAENDALNSYLVNHNEFSANSGMQGVLPYVRIVGYKPGH